MQMSTAKFLTGEDLVSKGATKVECTLPEVGVKDVFPNGSWLEQKQIQAALEARKHLIEVERINKYGALSHAEWREDLKLAKVIKKTGSYWQFLGHNVGNQLFLKPEEALFLMEVNCLRLKYNEVPVSLQQAYHLLLRDKINILQYKVYASLSRLGYKVFRHEFTPVTEYEKKINLDSHLKKGNERNNSAVQQDNNVQKVVKELESINGNCKSEPFGLNENQASITDSELQFNDSTNSYNNLFDRKLQTLKNRREKCLKASTHFFNGLPDMLHKTVVHINVPNKEFVPESIKFSKDSYVLNIKNVIEKPQTSTPEIRAYSLPDEVNDSRVPRIQDSSQDEMPNWAPRNFQQNTGYQQHRRFPSYPPHQQYFRPQNFSFQRSQNPYHNFLFNTGLNASFNYVNNFYNARFNFFRSHYQFLNRPRIQRPFHFQNYSGYCTFNTNNQNRFTRKRPHNSMQHKGDRSLYLNSIKQMVLRLRQQKFILGNVNQNVLHTLRILIRDYNVKYRSKLTLNSNFDVVDEEVVETIDLDNDDNSNENKRQKLIQSCKEYSEHLNAIKQLAGRLKNLSEKDSLCSKDKRAFTKLLKIFNSSYKSDIYINDEYEICDRKQIVLDSSSDSDCVVDDPVPKPKKLRNPFNILRRLSLETKNIDGAIASTSEDTVESRDFKYDESFKRIFNENWLPNENDFGRAEKVPNNISQIRLDDSNKMDYLYTFMSDCKSNFENWLDLKVCFWETITHDSNIMNDEYKKIAEQSTSSNNKNSLPVSKKDLIKPCKEIPTEIRLMVHFDVYERDVQNFRKSQKPPPHFRLICLDESCTFPQGGDVAAIHSQYSDNVPIVFAVVSLGSISYLQIKPEDLPVNIQESDYLY